MKTIGVLVVHGIGRQEQGESLRGLLRGLRRGFILPDPDGALGSFCRETDGSIQSPTLKLPDREIVFYEVHWAEVMEEFEWLSFSFTSLEDVSWFPWLNRTVPSWRCVYSDKDGRRATVVLLIVMVPLWLSLKTLAVLFDATRKLFGISRDFNQTFDATAGDVVNYVRSRRPVEPTSSAATSICSQFSKVLQLASGRCDEVHILAHSLGTVVAHDALTGGTRDSATEAPDDTGSERPFQKHLF